MVLSPDDFLIRSDGTYDWTPHRVVSAWRETLDRVKGLLEGSRYSTLVLLCGIPATGKSTWLRNHRDTSFLYVDATFTTRASRAPLVSLAASLGKPIDLVFIDTPFEECSRRTLLRPEDRQVPPEKMVKFKTDLEVEPPLIEEGFRSIIVVTPS